MTGTSGRLPKQGPRKERKTDANRAIKRTEKGDPACDAVDWQNAQGEATNLGQKERRKIR